MDKLNASAPAAPADPDPTADVDGGFDFEIEDVGELDIFTPFVMCSSTTSSSSCCA